MRPLKVLGALLSFGALAATAPAAISLDVRDEAKADCGIVTVYVTAPVSIGGGYSMTITRTSNDTAFVTKTVGKSTATDLVEVTISPPVSQSEISAVITGSAVLSISSGISSSVEETTTLRTTQTRTQTRTIYETTTHVNGDVEVNPVTVVGEPVTQFTSVPRYPRFFTWTKWHTTTVRTTTTLPEGNVVVASYTATNNASATISVGKKLHDGPLTTPTLVASSEEPEETFDPEGEIVVVEITRVVEPLITLPQPAETTSSDSSITNAAFPVFTAVPISDTNNAIVADGQKYSSPPSGWDNTSSTMAKVYASAPGYGYDHLSQDHSSSNSGLTTSVSGESFVRTNAPIASTSGPVYARSSIVMNYAPVNPYASVDWESAYWKGQTTSNDVSVSDSDKAAVTTEYEYWFASSALASVSNPPSAKPSYVVPPYGWDHSSSSASSSGTSGLTTTASRDPPASLRSTITVAPTSLKAPSFAAPTVTGSLGLPPLESVAPALTEELPESILSRWRSLDSDRAASHSSTPTKDVTSIAYSSSSSTTATSTSCGEQGAFSLNFDDIPPLIGDVDQPLPISSPYKHFFFSEGFAVGPPPRIPFIPDSAPLILQFQTQSNVDVTRNDNFPLEGEYGATGEIANGPNMRYGCYSFDAVAAAVGCDSLGPDCLWQFTGVTCDPSTGDCDEPYTQFATTPGCPAGENCALTDFVFLENFTNIQGLRVNVTVEGVPKIWWMDDLQLKWSDDSCDAGKCRASHR